MISVVMPVKDGGPDLARCLEALDRQAVDEEVEVVVVDSGSTDGSVALARQHGAAVHEVAPDRFNHGAARNLGAGAARGDVLVFTVQDAVAADDRWLASLVAPLRADPAIGGVYGRQLPHPGARPPEVWFLNFVYGPAPRRQAARTPDQLSMDETMFSNVNSAMRRSAWEPLRFAEDIIMSEDHDWVRRALLEGWTIAYEPRAAVRHSHPYTMADAFRRFFDSGASADRAYLAGQEHARAVLRRAALRYARGEIGWLLRTGQARWIPYTVAYELAKWAGLQLGARHRRLPLAVKLRCSALPGYWRMHPDGGGGPPGGQVAQ